MIKSIIILPLCGILQGGAPKQSWKHQGPVYYAPVPHTSLTGRSHLLCIRNCKCSSLQTDLVEEQIGEEFHRFTPSRLPPHGFTGSQERGLSSGVAPVDLSSTFHQQADQAKLTGGCRADEGAAVGKGVCHGLSGEGESDHHCQQQQPYCIIQIATAKQLKPLPWACFACCVKNQ